MPHTARDLLSPRPFPAPGLAALAAGAPLGGPREAALATLLVCRLARGAVGPTALEPDGRADRCAAVRQWLGTLALQLPVRAAAGRVLDAVADGDPAVVGAALLQLAGVAADLLDRGALDDVRRMVMDITA